MNQAGSGMKLVKEMCYSASFYWLKFLLIQASFYYILLCRLDKPFNFDQINKIRYSTGINWFAPLSWAYEVCGYVN